MFSSTKPKLLLDLNFHFLKFESFAQLSGFCKMNIGQLKFLSEKMEVQALYRSGFSNMKVIDDVIFKAFKKRCFFECAGIATYIKRIQPDYILIHGLKLGFLSFFIKKWLATNTIIVVQAHGFAPAPKGLKKSIYKWIDNYIDGYIFTGIGNGKLWSKAKVFNDNNIFSIMEGSTDFQYKQVIQKDPFTYLWVGRLNKLKDPVSVLYCFEKFLQEQPTAKLTMIYHEEDLIDEVENIVNNSSALKSNVSLLGKIEKSNMKNYYEKNQFFISASHREGSGYSLLEAMACGCVPIVTNIPSFKFMTNNGKVGLLFSPGNREELFNMFRQSVIINADEYSQEILEYFNQKLSFQAIAKDIQEVFESISKNKL